MDRTARTYLLAIGAFSLYLRSLRSDLYRSLGDQTLLSLTAASSWGSRALLHRLDLPALMVRRRGADPDHDALDERPPS